MRTLPVLRTVIVLACACLALAYLLGGLVLAALPLLALAGGWLFLLARRPTLAGTFGLFFFYAYAAAGAWIGLSLPLLFAGALLTLIAWDLTEFSSRLSAVKMDDETRQLENGHFQRLGWLTILSTLLGMAALSLQVSLNFEFGFVLVLLGVLGVALLVSRLRQEA